MYNQSFTVKGIVEIAKKFELSCLFAKFAGKEEVDNELAKTIDDFIYNRTTFIFRNINGVFVNGQVKDSTEYIVQNLLIRKLYHNIKNVYNVNQSNRNQIICQIRTMLEEDYPLWILRLDVKSFFESINRDRIINRFVDDCKLTSQSMSFIKQIFENPVIKSEPGVPRGLSISSAMSEWYMKYFDIKIQTHPDVYYYARFVDDIIIFCNGENGKNSVKQIVNEELLKLDLTLNTEKTKELSEDELEDRDLLTYLGYEFTIKTTSKSHTHQVTIDIASSKKKLIEARIVKSFARFIKDGDFALLNDRIKFLTGNYVVRNQKNLSPIRAGIHYRFIL